MLLSTHEIQTKWGQKRIDIYNDNLKNLNQSVDLLVCSAFLGDYIPTYSSLIGSLYWDLGISVEELSINPELDLRDLCVWVSKPIEGMIGRVACVEIKNYHSNIDINTDDLRSLYDTLFFAIKKCQQRGICVRSIALPILGTGNQGIKTETSMIPMLTECLSALKTLQALQSIIIFDRNKKKCEYIDDLIRQEVSHLGSHMAFISYSHKDVKVANLLANELESNGIKSWIDHRMIRSNDYAEDIVKGISESKAFLLLVSRNSMQSNDVLREVRNASLFADEKQLLIWPVLLERIQYPGSFSYYLTGLDYTDISKPPIEENVTEFCRTFFEKLNYLEDRK